MFLFSCSVIYNGPFQLSPGNQLVRFLWKRSSGAFQTDTGCKHGSVDSPEQDHDRIQLRPAVSMKDFQVKWRLKDTAGCRSPS